MSQSLETLKTQSHQLVGHRLPKETFVDFAHPNNRILIGVTCLRVGATDLAYQLFQSVAEEGAKENPNHHFAYVRSLIEMAEIDAERGEFQRAATSMAIALDEYPESMSYMMSRVHLEVYLAYYEYQAGRKGSALQRIAHICEREQRRFAEHSPYDAKSLIGPGLCYALYQWALFHAMDDDWERAVVKLREMIPYATHVDEQALAQADHFLGQGKAEEAFKYYESAISYT